MSDNASAPAPNARSPRDTRPAHRVSSAGDTFLARYAEYVRRNACAGRDVVRVGPFTATVNPDSPNPYFNYAVPDHGADPTDADVAALIATYRSRGRVPRLEYYEKLSPSVLEPLLRNGFRIEDRLALMAVRPGGVPGCSRRAGITISLATTDAELLAAATVQHEAYAEPEPAGQREVSSMRALLDRGGLVVVAVDAATGAPASGGSCTAIEDGFGEIGGIAVASAYRRRGVGTAITAYLARAAHAAGAGLVLLTPAGPAEQRIYERAGFQVVGDQLHASADHRTEVAAG